MLRLCPVDSGVVKKFIGKHHRHNQPPLTWKFAVGVENEAGELVGVGVAGLPKSRMLMINNPRAVEIQRTCTNGTKNANSMIYGALARAAKALGYTRMFTYTLQSESGASLRATGWIVDAERAGGRSTDWRLRKGYNMDLFDRKLPDLPKLRWRKDL